MACYHPLKGYIVGVNPETGKRKILIRPYIDQEDPVYESVTIPCGKCIGCRLDYSRQWANRLMLENEYHEESYFVTLTYNADHEDLIRVPYSAFNEDGEVDGYSLTLNLRDIQLWMKRVRKRFGDGIRFFASGEYGPETMRPHYHVILFGLHLDDLVVKYRDERGYSVYNSVSLERTWSDSDGLIGFVVVAPVTWETCAYVARYVTKKLTGNAASFYERYNLKAPFSVMSRRPGIAHQWYVDHPELFSSEYINLSTPNGGRKFRPPKYFDKLLEVDDPVLSDELRSKRRSLAEEAKKLKILQSDKSYLDLLADEELLLEKKVKALVRDKV